MVSGFFTSPCDHSRIFSGDASEMRIALNESGSLGFSKKLKMSLIGVAFLGTADERIFWERDEEAGGGEPGARQSRRCLPSLTLPPPIASRGLPGLDELDVQAERLELLDEHVEALREARLERVLALDDRLVHARAAHDVVALDGEELLQRVGRAVGFHRPDFHLAETLTAELRLATERLLRDERVRTDRARVDLVVDEVVELEHVHDAHRDVLVEGVAGAAVEEHRLAARRETRERRATSLIVLLGAPSKTGDAKCTPFFSLCASLAMLVLASSFESIFATSVSPSKILRMCSLICASLNLLVEHVLELPAERDAAPAEVDLEDLTDVHAARHAERVEHDVDRAAVLQVRHVLLRQDRG